ncbi:MAG: UDP-N-acetylenolpyruvoylglucosamine reductase [Flaviaesturariibacter sp.]|nr:UDP-N-acetylenolpyruvoylglucosamine reductase [Flaviaesturariibacter sp.]
MIKQEVSLKAFNTFGIDVAARYFSAFASVVELKALLAEANLKEPILVLGGGSNLLCTKNFDGLVLKNEIKGIELVGQDEDHVFIKAGAGENWHRFVQYCLDNNYAGAENLSLIPGNVGASPMQNIGAYGVEIKDIFQELEAVDIKSGEERIFSLEECRFGYRESVFKNIYKGQYIITSVTYRLYKKPRLNTSYGAIKQELERMGVRELSIQAVSQAVINIRTSKLPDWKELGNAGSFFKNPQVSLKKYEALKASFPMIVSYPQGEGMKLAAGWLIEQCGWKGYREGDAGCYSKQALVLVNYGKATGQQIFELSEKIIASVLDKFEVNLEREVNVI